MKESAWHLGIVPALCDSAVITFLGGAAAVGVNPCERAGFNTVYRANNPNPLLKKSGDDTRQLQISAVIIFSGSYRNGGAPVAGAKAPESVRFFKNDLSKDKNDSLHLS